MIFIQPLIHIKNKAKIYGKDLIGIMLECNAPSGFTSTLLNVSLITPLSALSGKQLYLRARRINLESTKLFFIILVSIVGMGYVYSGRKSSNYVLVGAGVVMMIFPYFITKAWAVIIISLLLVIGPFFVRR